MVLIFSLRKGRAKSGQVVLRTLHCSLHPAIRHIRHAVGIGVDVELVGILNAVQEGPDALSVADRTVLVAHEKSPKTPDLLMQLTDLLVERLVLGRVHFNLSLKVSQPLLLTLATLESSNTE